MADLPQNDVLNHTRVLEFTQAARLDLIAKLTKPGRLEDPKEQKVLLDALNGLDKAVFTNERLKLEEKIVDTQKSASALIATVLAQAGLKDIFVTENGVSRGIPSLPNDLPMDELVPDEMSTVPMREDYAELMAKTDSRNNADE